MKNRRMKYPLAVVIFSLFVLNLPAARGQETSEQGKNVRERILMDFDWQFAFGHPTDPAKDYGTGTGYFSYLAKTGYGDGAAAAGFDDRTWRTVDLPHDWAAEAPFDARGSHSHGYKAVGRNFPEASVGWYRKTFSLPADDKGKRISLEFDGVCRDARVWVNGFYCGNEPSGYYGFSFDITDFLNYGGENVVAVRTDVSLEEGWFYEGAGIYRHVWLNKTRPLHVPQNGTWVIANVENKQAQIIVHTKVYNQKTQSASFYIEQTVKDHNDNTVCSERSAYQILKPFEENEYTLNLNFHGPRLWSLEDPYRYVMLTRIVEGGKMVDSYETPFGIRTLRFDPEKGFFLNEESVKLLGTNNHQDHAGVGCAIPDALNEWRIRQLKSMG
ncbi:MAG TPA: beta galactosidase jelly roll domain-containing protein, partial [Prolixibacteraceae bacterium]|nr:beta galactosidase jelly roll domain-containing protein [Prolixibacteraceae bacterium]